MTTCCRFIYLFGQTEHRIEDTRSQVQYPMHQSLRTLIKMIYIIRHTHHLNQIRYNNRNRKLEYSTQCEFYSELSRIRAEECIKFGALLRRINMITDQDCRACCFEINTTPTNVTYSFLKHLKRY